MTLNQKDIQDIIGLLDDLSFDQADIEIDGLKLSLRRNGPNGGFVESAPRAAPDRPAQAAKTETTVADMPGAAPDGFADITAGLLGTFYRAPKPGADPYVKVGDPVSEGAVVGIIEVMKLMNPIAAGVSGEITEIFVEDAQLVQYGQTLFRVKTG